MEQYRTVWAWTAPYDETSKIVMGRQKNPDGTGYVRLEPGDELRYCEYCDDTVSHYPHTHTRAEVHSYQKKMVL